MQNDTYILFKTGFFSSLDYYLSDRLTNIARENNPIIKLSIALVSKAIREGQIYIDLEQIADKSITITDPSITNNISDNKNTQIKFKFPPKVKFLEALSLSILVGQDSNSPLVLDPDNKLYLARYYALQKRIADNILHRIQHTKPQLNQALFKAEIHKHFNSNENYSHDEAQGISTQKQAVQKALQNNFIIISGGPGTGKTYVIDIIAKIITGLNKSNTKPEIINTALTGKAASKLNSGLTIHRLLGLKNKKDFIYNHNKKKIAADCVIIDETSMIDISLMDRLLEAIDISTKLIFVGDKNQLGSIETGSIFSDLCKSKLLEPNIINLNYNFRSINAKTINLLADAVTNGNIKKLESILLSSESSDLNKSKDLCFINTSDSLKIDQKIENLITQGYTPYIMEPDIKAAQKKLNQFKILCTHRHGLYGTENLNMVAEKLLQDYQIHDINQEILKSIIMITKNDYKNLLFNGDTGILIEKNQMRNAVFFNDNSQDLISRSFNLSELKAFEKAFAITVHKSQGSEFDHVVFILPSIHSKLLTREIIYTAITRAKHKLTIAGDINIIKKAVASHGGQESGIQKMIDNNLDNHEK